MPKKAKDLSAVQVRRLTRPGNHNVGGVPGLLLQVTETGARSWLLRVQVGDRRRDLGMGGYPETTLEKARERARQARDLIRQGIDPVEQKRAARAALVAAAAKTMTFDDCARRYLSSKSREFRNSKHAAQWQSTLDMYASPVIGKLPVDHVELAHIVRILEPLWTEKTETAARLRGRIENVLAWATVSGFRSGDNPARWKGNLDAILPKPGKLRRVQHHKAIPWQEAGAFMARLRARDGMAARGLEFVVLTAARSGEVRGATWAEIDLEAKLWTVPAERMKAQAEHVVPLCADALALLKALPRMEGSQHVFPAARGGMLSDAALSAVMKRMSVDATPHGFRSTFRDWCSENTNYPREVAEKALAHVIPSAVERAYRRGDLMTKRMKLMQDWCKFLNKTTTVGNVLPMRAKA